MQALIKAILGGKPMKGTVLNGPGEIFGWQSSIAPTPKDEILAALEVIKQRAECGMLWVDARTIEPQLGKHYIVKTNGNEWRDFDLHLWPAPLLQHHLGKDIVRGRPIWVAEVTEPRS